MVEQAERFGHDELQPIARRVFRWAGIARQRGARMDGPRGGRLADADARRYAFKPVMLLFGRAVSKASDEQVRQDLARLPELLDQADMLVESGTIGSGAPNAADLQILTSIRLLMMHEDLRPMIARRPSGIGGSATDPGLPAIGD